MKKVLVTGADGFIGSHLMEMRRPRILCQSSFSI
jgi:nucleoside-diphosphate-sugar epimerase